MFLTPFGFSEESEEMMGEGDRLDREDLELEGERGGRVFLCCRLGWFSTLAIESVAVVHRIDGRCWIPYVIWPNKANPDRHLNVLLV